MRQINPLITGITLLLVGIVVIIANYFITNNLLYGGIGIFCVVAGLAMGILNSLRKED